MRMLATMWVKKVTKKFNSLLHYAIKSAMEKQNHEKGFVSLFKINECVLA